MTQPLKVRVMTRAARRRGNREEVSRDRMVALNIGTLPQRAKRWAMRLLAIGTKPADVTKITGVEIRKEQR